MLVNYLVKKDWHHQKNTWLTINGNAWTLCSDRLFKGDRLENIPRTKWGGKGRAKRRKSVNSKSVSLGFTPYGSSRKGRLHTASGLKSKSPSIGTGLFPVQFTHRGPSPSRTSSIAFNSASSSSSASDLISSRPAWHISILQKILCKVAAACGLPICYEAILLFSKQPSGQELTNERQFTLRVMRTKSPERSTAVACVVLLSAAPSPSSGSRDIKAFLSCSSFSCISRTEGGT